MGQPHRDNLDTTNECLHTLLKHTKLCLAANRDPNLTPFAELADLCLKTNFRDRPRASKLLDTVRKMQWEPTIIIMTIEKFVVCNKNYKWVRFDLFRSSLLTRFCIYYDVDVFMMYLFCVEKLDRGVIFSDLKHFCVSQSSFHVFNNKNKQKVSKLKIPKKTKQNMKNQKKNCVTSSQSSLAHHALFSFLYSLCLCNVNEVLSLWSIHVGVMWSAGWHSLSAWFILYW